MVLICSVILLSVGCWVLPYHGVMIITAYVGVDQWLLMVTFLPYPARPTTGCYYWSIKIVCKTGTGQGFLSGRSSHQSVEETPIFSQFSSPTISSSRATIESPSLSKFSGQKINVFPITRGPPGPAWLSSVLTTILVNTKACPHYNNTQHSSQQILISFSSSQ